MSQLNTSSAESVIDISIKPDYQTQSLELHSQNRGKLEIGLKVPLENRNDLSLAYTPGVAAVSQAVSKDKNLAYEYTIKGNAVAVVTDGSAVLGLGNIGPEAALPVMEGKAILFKKFAGIDAYPICLDTQDTDKIVETVKMIAPGFGGVNLEDISAPRCFEVEERLQDLGIPVFHDDQHGTAVVVLAGLMNAAKVVGKDYSKLKVVINGSGAAGVAISKLLKCGDIIMCDSKGIIHSNRSDLNSVKQSLLQFSNKSGREGGLADALVGADVFIGVSVAGALTKEMISQMADKPIVFAMANPVPEIMPDEAAEAGVEVIATGRSDFPNQVNNVLAFPGIFRAALDARAPRITEEMKLAAAEALASLVENPTRDKILPSALDKGVAEAVALAVRNAC
jgi:malate dehydrogenase (oxaloacetate-decarboxylating)